MQSASSSTSSSTLQRRLRVLIVGGGLSTSRRYYGRSRKAKLIFCFMSGGLTLANGLLNAAPFVPLDITVFEKDQVEYLKERGGYQIRVSLIKLDRRSINLVNIDC